jgi:hypothetical protein
MADPLIDLDTGIPVRRRHVLVALGVTLATALPLTAAAYTDAVYLNASGHVGQTQPFDVVLVVDGLARHAPLGQPVDLTFDEGTNVIRLRQTLSLTVQLANNHPSLGAHFFATVTAQVEAGGDIRPYMKYNVLTVYPSGGLMPVCMNCTWDLATGHLSGGAIDLGYLHARGAAPVGEGEAWSRGADDSDYTLMLLATLVDDDPAVRQVPDGRLRITITFTAQSATP